MNRFSKSAVVVITIACVMFFAISLFTFFVQPNAEAEMTIGPLQEFAFEKVPGETPSWKVTRRTVYARDIQPDNTIQKDVGNYPNAYKAVLEAHKDLVARLRNETSRDDGPLPANKGLTERREAVETELAAYTQHQTTDATAIRDRIQYLEKVLDDPNADPNLPPLRKQIDELSRQFQNLVVESTAIRSESQERRTDVTRLQSELEETRTDFYRLKELEKELTDQLVRLQLELQSLQERHDQLRQLTE
ncbi:MAG: hypothetical protein KDA96_05325 [Planctomycetaceae bacterium]|nr:hypothetical protein [Planctomycetaceae bacterium]